ncbi:MAG: hypothetical protein NZM26_04220 [Patescibacteria group bacterium]|nr:hypothetical protein [Patescibacteria group bacterium]
MFAGGDPYLPVKPEKLLTQSRHFLIFSYGKSNSFDSLVSEFLAIALDPA